MICGLIRKLEYYVVNDDYSENIGHDIIYDAQCTRYFKLFLELFFFVVPSYNNNLIIISS